MSELTAGSHIIGDIDKAWNTAHSSWNDSNAEAFQGCIDELKITIKQLNDRACDMDQKCQIIQMRVREIAGQ